MGSLCYKLVMKKNKLSIKINKPASLVFAFILDPQNTPLWIDGIEIEETNESPVKLNTIYRNRDSEGNWNEYSVKDYRINKLFELISMNGNYHVRYTYLDLADNKSELEYFEWVDKGELDSPFSQNVLEKLKRVIENG